MNRFRFDARVPHIVIVAGGALLLVFSTVAFARGRPAFPAAVDVAMWLGLMTGAVLFAVPRRGRGAPATASCALEFGAMLVFGAPIACWLALASRLIGARPPRWSTRTLADIGLSVASIVAAGWVYDALGGAIGAAFTLHWGSGIALLVAATTFLVFLLALPFLTGFLGLREPTPARLSALRDECLWQSSLLPFGVPAAFVQLHLGVLGGALLGLPLLIAARARYVWRDARCGHLEAMRTLMTALDAFDPFTRGHSYRIAKMSVRVGRDLGLDVHALEELEYAALLHDVGRTAVHDELLPRNPSLNVEQQSVLRQHPQRGGDIVARFGFYPGAADIVYAHHEQPDGQGYPKALSAEQIPIGSLIIMVVTAFDAMTSDRPYRRGLQPEVAFDELRAHAGAQFAPEVVEALVSLYTDAKLFEDFAPEILDLYARGEGNSRAIYEHLRRIGTTRPAATTVAVDELIGQDDVPELDLPSEETAGWNDPKALARALRLSADGSWRLELAARTDVGCIRDNNEDSYGAFQHARRPECLLVVADGMGGAAAGEVASRLAVETLRTAFMEGEPQGTVQHKLRQAIQTANEVIRTRAAANDDLFGMGTTCVAASLSDRQLHVGHVGDSRAYLVDPRGIRQITRDHNLAEELKCMVGANGPDGAQHVLTRSLGSRPAVEVDVSEAIQLQPDHVLVLCSDGLSNLVGSDEIRDVCQRNAPAVACARLIALARERGAPDNVTVQVARVRRT